MNDIITNLSLLFPELSIAFIAIMSLLYGSLTKTKSINKICYVVNVLLLIIAISLITMPTNPTFISNDMLVITDFTQYGKLLVVLSLITFLVLLPITSQNNYFLSFETIPISMLSSVGMMVMISSNNFISLYLGLEIMSLSLYILVALNKNNLSSSEAGIKYFIMGSLSSCLYLLGASFLYAAAGHLSFAEIMENILTLQQTGYYQTPFLFFMITVGIVLILVSFAFKIAAAPFQMWSPDVYQGSSWIITSFLSTGPKIASLFSLARILYSILIPIEIQWSPIVLIVAIISMFVGGIGAIMQKSIKRIMAYSSISHIGFLLLGLMVGNEDGLIAFIAYTTIYLTLNLGIFSCFIMLTKGNDHDDSIKDLAGLGKKHPILGTSLTILMLSMAGIPPFAGFFAKFYIVLSLIVQDLYFIAILAVIASTVSAYYYLRFIKVIYFDNSNKEMEPSYSIVCNLVVFLMIMFNLLYIFVPDYLLTLAQAVTKSIFDT